MSTQKIREALERLQRSAMDNAEVTALVAEAIQEVKAIEMACVTLHLSGVVQCLGGDEHEDVEQLDKAADYLMGIGQAVEESK